MSELSDYEAVEYLEGLREDLKNDVIDEDLQALDRAIEKMNSDEETKLLQIIARLVQLHAEGKKETFKSYVFQIAREYRGQHLDWSLYLESQFSDCMTWVPQMDECEN